MKNYYDFLNEELDIKKFEKDRQNRINNIIREMGDEYIDDLVRNSDYEGIEYLIKNGYNIKNCDSLEHLQAIAINNLDTKMMDYLISKGYDYLNTVLISYLIKKIDGLIKDITEKELKKLKMLADYGYNFNDNNYNHFKLYLLSYSDGEDFFTDSVLKFITWIIEKYPKNYILVKDYLPDDLKEKYKYLSAAVDHGLI